MRNLFFVFAFLFSSTYFFAQNDRPPFTPGTERMSSLSERNDLRKKSLLAGLPFQSIGPSVFGGRVADVEVSPNDPTHFYVAYASGGLWKTENNGQSFTPIFDREMVMTIGDIAVDWEREIIWVGTGEVNSSRSSYAGIGMYRSGDGGKSWAHRGLPESHHIGRVILHPSEPNTLWVAVLGHLYSANQERGIYKTTDGGQTWKRTHFVNGNTGAVDLIIDPTNPDVLYAAMWERERRAWNFSGSGKGSGIWKSTDGGENWSNMTTSESGFPTGEGVGRIGLSCSVVNGKTILFSILDNQNRRPKEEEEEGLTKNDFKGMSRENFLEIEDEELESFLRDNRFPKKYTAENIKRKVRKNKIRPIAIYEYLTDSNSELFDTPVIGAEVYRSDDGGNTWRKTHDGFLDDIYYSYGYYFGQIRSAKNNPSQLYIFGVPILKSKDGGAHWENINGDNVHVDHHDLWISPDREGHLILGNDGGINISYDDGENWVKCNTPPIGQFYHVAVDNQKNYHVYGGLQDNGVWYGSHDYEASNRWHNTGQYPYKRIMGGDGMQTEIDSRDNKTVYTGFQFGFYYRINRETNERKKITPKHELGERPLRWNWQSPIHLSEHNEDILYMGANKLFRSFNQGDEWKAISEDLTKGGKKGNVAYGTLTTIHESPLKFGLLYVGSDDGLIHVSKDGGTTWQKISDNLPKDLWVSRVRASKYTEGRVYATLNGYRWDDFQPYVYVSENYGETWKKITNGLPMESVNVIKEDPANENIIYVGTDHGLYISLDRGENYSLTDNGLPAVSVHDVVVHPTENDLIVGTHGRSIYLADIDHLQKLTDSIIRKPIYAFSIDKIEYDEGWGNKGYTWSEEYDEPTVRLPIYVSTPSDLFIKIKSGRTILNTWEVKATKGLNYFEYNAEIVSGKVTTYEEMKNEDSEEEIKLKKGENGKYYLLPGTYTIEYDKDRITVEKELIIE